MKKLNRQRVGVCGVVWCVCLCVVGETHPLPSIRPTFIYLGDVKQRGNQSPSTACDENDNQESRSVVSVGWFVGSHGEVEYEKSIFDSGEDNAPFSKG